MSIREIGLYEKIWKTKKTSWVNPLHSMCSYLAMFPPSLPNYFIRQFTEKGDTVFDPFSGRGTTVLEASLNGRIGIGNDLNPLAHVLTSAKAIVPEFTNVLIRLNELKENYAKQNISDVEPDIRMLYDEEITLPMLIYLKKNLDLNRKVDNFIMGVLLGIMHGKHRKDGTSMYLSIPMPNTFSMSPNYVRNYINKHSLPKIKQNVFDILKERIIRLYPFNYELEDGKSYKYDAVKINNYRHIIKDESVDMIFTSPPYLKVIKYGKYNWIRLWMLGINSKSVDDKLRYNNAYYSSNQMKLSDTLRLDEYLIFMRNLIVGWERILKPNSLAFVVIGDVNNLNLAKEVWNYVSKYTNLNLIGILDDEIAGNSKVTKIWGNERKGEATKVDRILILSRGEPKKPKYPSKKAIIHEFSYFNN